MLLVSLQSSQLYAYWTARLVCWWCCLWYHYCDHHDTFGVIFPSSLRVASPLPPVLHHSSHHTRLYCFTAVYLPYRSDGVSRNGSYWILWWIPDSQEEPMHSSYYNDWSRHFVFFICHCADNAGITDRKRELLVEDLLLLKSHVIAS